ncbi:MAG: hypothetical protein ACYTFG_15475 [Planctomycetota bacterium]|jgi:hypothetical protein
MDRRNHLPLFAAAVVLFAAVLPSALGRDKRPKKETVVIMKTTQGEIFLRFFPDKAPEHV